MSSLPSEGQPANCSIEPLSQSLWRSGPDLSGPVFLLKPLLSVICLSLNISFGETMENNRWFHLGGKRLKQKHWHRHMCLLHREACKVLIKHWWDEHSATDAGGAPTSDGLAESPAGSQAKPE